MRLPFGVTADPGPIKVYPNQRGIAEAIADPNVERVRILKSARIEYTATLTATLAQFIVREPSPILVLMPNSGQLSRLHGERH